MHNFNIESDQTVLIHEPITIQEEAIQHQQLHNDLQKYSQLIYNSNSSTRQINQQHDQARSLKRGRSTIILIEIFLISQSQETKIPKKEKPFKLIYDNYYSSEVKEYTESICNPIGLENIQIKLTNSVYEFKDHIIENNAEENGSLPLPFSQHQKQNSVYQPNYLLKEPNILNQSIPNENRLDFQKSTFKLTNSKLMPAQIK